MPMSRLFPIASLLLINVAFWHAAGTDWLVRPEGVGPIKIGMTPRELSSVLQQSIQVPTSGDEKDCFYFEPKDHPGLSVMILHKRVGRVDIANSQFSTAEGVRIGDSEEHARKVYGSGLKVEPHHYDAPEGHYLTILSAQHRLGVRFETYNGKITSYYAGTSEAISLVEGCS